MFASGKLYSQVVIIPALTNSNVAVNQTSFILAILSLRFVSIDDSLS
jgi:hypothetical protein